MVGVTTRSSARNGNLRNDGNNENKSTPKKHKVRGSRSEIRGASTPPKQLKVHTNDHLDLSPSSLLQNLVIKSPQRSSIAKNETKINTIDKNTSELVKENCDNSKRKISQYANARRALHSNTPKELPGRESEIQELGNFIEKHLNDKTSGSVYVSGPPGTGKTATLNLILQREEVASKVQAIYINCTSIKSAQTVYSRIIKELKLSVQGKPQKEYLAVIQKYLMQNHKTVLLILDEIDQLESKNQSILYTIFEWPARPNSKLILVGIANALDFTDRMLPRLQSRCELQPKLVHFAPYTKEQIVKIFTSRLEAAGISQVFSAPALQILAGKVASISGDIRRALDIGRRVIELMNQDQKSDILKSVENFSKELDNIAVEDDRPKTVNVQEVIKILNSVYSTTQNLTDEIDETFPLQQKIVVCTLLLLLKKAKNKIITLGKLHEVYKNVCSKRNIQAVDQAEFVGLCSLIETRGIIKISGKKDPRLHKVTLEWNENEVAEALKDKQLMSTILHDESCLVK